MFKDVEECVGLYKQGKESDSEFWYVFNCEETQFDEFDIDGNTKEQLQEIKENSQISVSDGRDIFMEFTANICPAYKK